GQYVYFDGLYAFQSRLMSLFQPNLLQAFFAISGIVIFVIALDISRRQKFNALHFLVFLGIGGGLLLFTAVPQTLDLIGRIFGIPRGADVLVYAGIVFLSYFSLLLLNKTEKNREDTTRLVREIALHTGAPKDKALDFSVPVSKEGRPNPKKSNVAFLIRSYNEAARIGEVLDAVVAAGFSKILVVDDGSRDATSAILARRPEIMVVRHPQNRGGGAALETGLEFFRRYGRGLGVDFITTFDADGQHDVADVSAFMDAFKKDDALDIVLGSRFVVKTRTNVPFFRHIILMGGKVFTRLISGISLTDSHNGYRMLRIASVEKIRLTMDGMEYASELIERVSQLGLKFKEVPVNIRYDEYSLGKGQKSSNAFNIAAKMIWSKFFR
ncbi:MAG: hypothetical protein QG650_392, partial [Patescibacteria group bacterium]|nr:hypothetical protein [Patescibacteria group bacterium]